MAKPKKIDAKTFVTLYLESWEMGHTMSQLAERLGMTYQAVYARSRFYRQRWGVALPALRRAESPQAREKQSLAEQLRDMVDRRVGAEVA